MENEGSVATNGAAANAGRFGRDYFIGGGRSHYRDYREIEGAIDEAFMPTVRRYAQWAGSGVVDRRSLDVGCAMGFYVERLAADGWESHGIDLSEFAVDEGRRRGIANLRVGSATELPFEDGSFDFVTAIDVIEHIPAEISPTMVAETHRVLRPGGLAFYATPNYLTNAFWNKFTPGFFDEDETHINYQSDESLRSHFEAFSECHIYGETPFIDQFRAVEVSRAFGGRGFGVPVVGDVMRRMARSAAWKLLGRDVRYSSYLHAVAVR
jgi:2-polyprenyl-3-methyl-5-hydroxy-6-metoxy-1,4-benzoquinol methylase